MIDIMLITHDVFDISDRLKEIDPDYTLHYNGSKGKFELRGKDNVLLITYPYEKIDARMIVHARKTRVERSRELLREMEEHNAKLERARKKAQDEFYLESLKETAERYYAERR